MGPCLPLLLPFPPCCARSVFHRSTSSFTSSRNELSSPISCSSCLKSAPISLLRVSSSCAAPPPASRCWSAPYRSRSVAAALGIDDSATRNRSSARPGQLGPDGLGGREQLFDVEDDDETLSFTAAHDTLEIFPGEPSKE